MSKVSVIIPTYNCATYISEAIDSVLAQTYNDFEIIVVDDGSSDNTKSILQRYSDKIKYIYQKNGGVAAARNTGIKEAKGEYIAMLEDDIWILPQKIELQVNILDANPDVAMVFTDAEIFEKNTVIRSSWSRSNYPQKHGSLGWQILQKQFNDGSVIKRYLFQEMLYGCPMSVSTILIRKSCTDYIGLFDSNFLTDDYDYWIRVSEKFPLVYLNKVTTRYRYREDGLSGKTGLREAKYNNSNGLVYQKLIKTHPELKKLLSERIYLVSRAASWWYLNNFYLKQARELAIRSLQYKKFQPKLYLYILISLLPLKLVKLLRSLKSHYVKS